MRKLINQRHFVLIMIWIFSAWNVLAQDVQVQGKVTDASSGDALPGVSISVKGSNVGTISDFNGSYQITAPKGSTLVFSFIGYLSQEIVVNNPTLNVQLQSDVKSLQEVVVIGYGTVRKADATGSVATISSRDFNKGAITTPQDLLIGKAAGVIVSTPTGAPGAQASIRIRGGSSLNASNDPLIIIDGVPIDNNNIGGSSNLLSIVNPNDIDNFTILKDASATAIYGSRASNGVIIITTKKGKVGSGTRVSYTGNFSLSDPIKFMDVYSGDEMREIAYEHKNLYGADAYRKLGSANTDWQKEIYQTGALQDHNLSLSGAVKTLPYRVSLGYTDQSGILYNTGFKRMSGAISLDPTFLNNNLKISINAKGMNTDQNFGDAGAVGNAVNMDPTQPVKDGNETYGGYFQWISYGASLGTPNPVEEVRDIDNRANVKRIIGNIQFDYTLPFISGLRANLNLATDYSESKGHNNLPITTSPVLTNPMYGRLTDFNNKNKNNLLEFYANYTKDLTDIKSRIDATAGYSWQHFERQGFNYQRTRVVDATHPYQRGDSSSFITENFLVSFFGRVNYTYNEKYLLTATLRDDGSSRFTNNHWGLFPSVALAWKINQESFLQNVKAITDLKLRLGWGVTGQQDIGNDYPAQARYINSSEGSYYVIGGDFIPTLRPSAYDPEIKWEETTTQNIGLDFGFFNERITGSLDLYNRKTKDLLNTVTLATESNFSNTLLTNIGSLQNKGIEVNLNLVPVSKRDMSLSVGFNFTYNKNKITKLQMTDDPNYKVLYGGGMGGQTQVTTVGYPAYSFFMNKQVYDANGKPIEGLYVDLSGKGGTINGNTADQYIYHNPVPDYLIGLYFRFNYKNFDIYASTRTSIGNYVYNQVLASSSYDQLQQIGYWKNFPKKLEDYKFVKRQFTSDYFIENASYFKLDNISAGYNFKNIISKFTARVSFTIQNALTATKYSGIDPEVPGGIDNNFYPRPRTFMLGVTLNY